LRCLGGGRNFYIGARGGCGLGLYPFLFRDTGSFCGQARGFLGLVVGNAVLND
jgi:hypothetical protein